MITTNIMIPMAMATTRTQIIIKGWKVVFLIWMLIPRSVAVIYAIPLSRVAPFTVPAFQSTLSLGDAMEPVALFNVMALHDI